MRTTGTHRKGELYVDNTGQLFYCVADSTGGNGGSWVKLSAPGSTITYLDNPVRVLGTPNVGFTAFPKLTANKVAYFPIVGTQTNTVPPANTTTISATIPTTAVAVIGTLSAFNATSVGFITAYPANAPTVPVVASLLYSAGQFANTSVNLKLGIIPAGQNGAGQLGIGLLSIQDCNIAFDVVAYQN